MAEKQYDTKTEGDVHTYETGATRNRAPGKGRFDLISPIALKRLAQVYERGGISRGDRNWEKGFPIGDALDSAERHINQYKEGDRSEDHLAQAAWNLFAAIHIEVMIERGLLPAELDNLPNYTVREDDNG